MSATVITAKLWNHLDPDEYNYELEVEFSGTYANNTVGYSMTYPEGNNDIYPVNIQFLTDENKTSESGTTTIDIDIRLDGLIWGTDHDGKNDYISIDVNLIDAASQSLSNGGGVVSQSEAETRDRPAEFVNN